MSTVIKVENVSKQYRLGTIGTGTLSHDLNRWWHRARGKEDPYLKVGQMNDRTQKGGTSEYVWALKDVDFEVSQGDVVGIIGRNGAGKSTLLKILSRTTLPTAGSIKVKGRIASLLEVGTGFHPELTGRENIYLNGAILGMRKAEIRGKFDEIVDFAGVEKYVDTPVKRYSSGMYVRLAFAVAAHLEPEILIVDEVLAVGDTEFQQKALGKMQAISAGGGRTVLFVSHNMGAVSKLCNKGVLLKSGTVQFIGSADEAVHKYTSYFLGNNTVEFNHPVIKSATALQQGASIVVEVRYQSVDSTPIHLGFVLSDQYGNKVCGSNPGLAEQVIPASIPTNGVIRMTLSEPKLNDGSYLFSLWAGNGYKDFFSATDCIAVQVESMAMRKRQRGANIDGYVVPIVEWDFQPV